MGLALELSGLRTGVLLKKKNYRGKFKKQKKLDWAPSAANE